MSEVRTETATDKIEGQRAKNGEWKSKAAAPAEWVSALLRGKRDGSSVLLEFKNGPKSPAMLAEAFRFDLLEGHSAYLSVAPLAVEIWEAAQVHRSELDGDRYYYRIRVVNEDEEGDTFVIHESAWIELAAGDAGDVLSPSDAFEGDGVLLGMLRMQQAMIIKLFSANIQNTRASGQLLRMATEGVAAGLESQFNSVKKVQEFAQDGIDMRMKIAESEGDAAETREYGLLARTWLANKHEIDLAKSGVQAPKVPKSRSECARGLYQSLTVNQLEELERRLGERAELLIGFVKNAGDMSDGDIEQFLESAFDSNATIELMGVAQIVFSTKFVPSTWAIWQSRVARVLLEGPDSDEEAA